MTTRFNPYQQWLGIPLEEQPPDYYRLLGLARFENNPAAIQLAAEQRMAHVRAFQTGPRAEFTQQLLNELAAAKVRLLNPAAKQQYDAALADAISLGDGAFSPDLLPPLDEPPAVEVAPRGDRIDVHVQTTSLTRSPSRGFDPWMLGWWIPLGGSAIALTAAAVWFIAQNPSGSGAAVQGQAPRSRSSEPPPRSPVVVRQEANGDVLLSCTVAEMQGNVQRQFDGTAQVLTGWSSFEDSAEWSFRLTQLPSQGIFRVLVTYRADAAAGGARYALRVDDESRVREILVGRGEVVDEFYLAVPRTGLHRMTVQLSDPSPSFALKAIALSFPQRAER
jgi:hypothetical protein